MSISKYIDRINQQYKLGHATEHSYRGDLAELIKTIVPEVIVTNEPKRQSCGAPDYILTKKNVPIGFIEAKNIGDKDLEGIIKNGNKEQFDRYKSSLNNLIFTDYIDFHFYQDGELTFKIAIAKESKKGIEPLPENFGYFENQIKDFCAHVGQTIKNPRTLSKLMAGKARLLSDIISKILASNEVNEEDSSLKAQMDAFKKFLIHDIAPQDFADVYAQTITYGMFAARLHDPSLNTFSRQEAAELIPKSNPFLRKLFAYIAGPDIDNRISWVVDNLSEIFLACDVRKILKKYGDSNKMENPIIHFYETFLAEYDPDIRKSRGVWYTPTPVVNFIIRAVDDILITEFDLEMGLADSSKIKVPINTQTRDRRSSTGFKQIEKEVHKVQILDPATGTGAFLAETVKHINKKFEGQEGIWSSYIENELIPRLNGFELLMASYAMAHLQLHLLFAGTGYSGANNQRTKIYLTNSLEEHHPDTGTLFANWLSSEANEANHIKRDMPVMCVIGNPPYAVSSSNKGEWIEKLTSDYKKDLNERNIQPLSDDYIKFIRYGQYHIEKNGEGVLAYISNNSFIDGIIHRNMRRSLLQTFDSVYILDLHGNSRKKEVCPDGSTDQNVFDIMQGVSINLFIKKGNKKANQLGRVYHSDLYGKREAKYSFLEKSSISSIEWKEIKAEKPYYFFIDKDLSLLNEFNRGINLRELFPQNSMGIATGRDAELVDFFKEELHSKFDIDPIKFNYRPFDIRFTVFDKKILQRSRFDLMSNYLYENIGLNVVRQSKLKGIEALVNKNISNRDLITNHTYNFPLYLYSNKQDDIFVKAKREPNLNHEIINQLAQKISLTFTKEKEDKKSTFSPIDVLDYIYAILLSGVYREKYKEYLKIDFPRVPYPKNQSIFRELVKLGSQLREIHLLESSILDNYITSYPKNGNNIITTKIAKKDWELFDKENQIGRIWINDKQYFDKIPLNAWEFYIGGNQPAQKWLKDRKERELKIDDILLYQKIIVSLVETQKLIKKIDALDLSF